MMKFLQKNILFFICLVGIFSPERSFCQSSNPDSLYKVFESQQNPKQKLFFGFGMISNLINNTETVYAKRLIVALDKIKVDPADENVKEGLICIAKGLYFQKTEDIDESNKFTKKAIRLLKSQPHYLADAQTLLALNYLAASKHDSCIIYGNSIINQVVSSKNTTCEIEIYSAMSLAYEYIGNRQKAVELTLKAVQKSKQQNNKSLLIKNYVNLASIYKQEDLNLAKQYGLLALKELDGNQKSSSTPASYLMLGNIYYDLHVLDSAQYYYELCQDVSRKGGDKRMFLAAIGNLGNIAMAKEDYIKAIDYNRVSLVEYKRLNLPSEVAVAFGSLADIYKDKGNYELALKYYDSALVITKQINSVDDYIYNYQGMSTTYEKMGDYKQAFTYYKLYKFWSDSVNNNSTSKKISEMQLDFKYKAEQQEKDLIQKNKDLITQEKIKQQTYIIWAAVLGGLCLVIFLGFTIKSNIEKKKTNKQLQHFNNEISEQKNIIEEKNNEITDSITYASRIQQGVIPDEEELQKLLPHHFVFFKPRDIVSGDFYWASKVKSKTNPESKRTVVAVVDCTGHGVPGAFMSLVGNTLLNQTIGRSAIETPAQALDYINAQLPKTIKSKLSTGTIKDGMEVAMCDFHFDTLTMYFAGANSNIYLVRNGEIQIYKGDKQPIGESLSGAVTKYNNQVISLQKDDCVYLISDGYADQFGGEKGKKFKYKPLENLFCSIASKDVKEQRDILAKAFDEWKSHHEQVDDVLIMGIKI